MSEETLFEQALSLPATEREAYLSRECPDAALRERVLALIAASAAPRSPIDPPEGATSPHMGPNPVFTGSYHAAPEAPGVVIAGKYTLVEPIGEGGMGSVWRAKQTEPVKRFVAIKLIKAGMDSRQVLARFDAERQALAVMDHPNIAKVLDGGLHDSRPFFAMELVKGVPITDFCDARKLTPRGRLELFVSVCQAIQHAHQKGIIHRDIKPTNVLVALYDDKPVVKVIDFGVAKATGGALTEQTIDTGFGGVVGTPQYMSPEQATFNNLDIDTRSDIYSLGVLLYELLTGSPPFTRKDLEKQGLMEMLRVVREVEPPRPSTKLSTADALPSLSASRGTEPKKLTGMLRSELDWVVMKALEKDRTRRYESANGFAADVLRYLGGEAVVAHPPSAAYRLKKFVRRNKGRVAAASVIAVSLVAGIVGTSLGMVEAKRQEGEARKQEGLAITAKEHADDERKIAEGERDQKEQARKQAVAEKDRADREKAVAEAVKDFVTKDIFGRAGDARLGQAADIKARTLLEEAAKTVGEKFRDQPEVELAVRWSLAYGFNNVGLTVAEVEQLKRILELCRMHRPKDHLDTLAVLIWLGNRSGGTLDMSREAFEGYRRVLGDSDRKTIDSAHLYVWALVSRNPTKALEICEQFVEIGNRALGADAAETCKLLECKASILAGSGRHDEALAILQAIRLSYVRTHPGGGHPPQYGTYLKIAGLLQTMGKHDEAIALFKQDISDLSKVLNREHAEVTYRRSGLANSYWAKRDWMNAGPAYLDVAEGDRRTNGPNVVWALTAQRRAVEALRRVSRIEIAVSRAEAWSGSDKPDDLAHAASLYCDLIRTAVASDPVSKWRERAMDLLRRAVDRGWTDTTRFIEFSAISDAPEFRTIIDRMSRGDASALPKSLVGFAASHRVRKRHEDAARYMEEAILIQREVVAKNAGHEHREALANYLETLGQTYFEIGNLESAVAMHREAHELRVALVAGSTGEKSAELRHASAWSLHYQAHIHLEAKRYEEAAKLFEAAATEREKLFAEPIGERSRIAAGRDLDWLGRTWERAGDWPKAEAGYRRALAIREALMAAKFDEEQLRSDVDWSQQRLAGALNQQQKYAEAADILRRNVDLYRKTNQELLHDAQIRLGFALIGAKQWPEAVEVLKDCLARREKQIPSSVMTFSTRSLLGEAYTGLKDYKTAEPLLLKGYEELKANEQRIPASGKARIPLALDRLIGFYEATGDAASAAKYRELRKRYPETAPPPREKK
ncbi:MAG: tetratricopeptide repeat protein [Gemmataceae bacterium]